ncbi:TonB-dependent receptor domain-containing protein, partial [Klebsiella pneumoniae]
PGTTTGGFNSDCAINDAWCTSLTNPDSRNQWLGSSAANKNLTTTTTETTSVYLLDNIEFSPQWLLDLGLRWDKFDTKQTTNATGDSIENNTDFLTYQAGLIFKPVENGSIYASYATSANPVGV